MLPHIREANVLKVVVVVPLYYNPDSGSIHYENFSIFLRQLSQNNLQHKLFIVFLIEIGPQSLSFYLPRIHK